MKAFLIDINVVLDFLTDRKPFSEPAIQLINLAESKRVNLYISAFSYYIIYFYVKKYTNSHLKTIAILSDLIKITKVIDTTDIIIKESIESSFNDFEDAMQNYSALKINTLNGIITQNFSDFKQSNLPILMPEEALAII